MARKPIEEEEAPVDPIQKSSPGLPGPDDPPRRGQGGGKLRNVDTKEVEAKARERLRRHQ